MYHSRRVFLQNLGIGAAFGSLAECISRYHSPLENGRSERVLIVGIDGLRSDALQAAVTPNIDRLRENGAYSFNARTGEDTISGPGWTNNLTGVWADKHGVVSNDFVGHKKYPNLFTRVRESGLKLHSEASVTWKPLHDHITLDADRHSYFPVEKKGDERAAAMTTKSLQTKDIHCVFSYFQNVDVAGHAHGFSPAVPEYVAAIEKVDLHTGEMLSALQKRPTYHLENWMILVITDHGGAGKSHYQVEEAKKIPFIMYGPSVKKGEILPAPTQVEVVPTVLTHLGVPIRQEWGLEGKVVGLKESYIK